VIAGHDRNLPLVPLRPTPAPPAPAPGAGWPCAGNC